MFLRFNDTRILQDENYQKVPLECPLCKFMLRFDDISTYKKNECCNFCLMMVVDPNREKWKKGWRPSEKEMSKVIKNRKEIPSYIMRGL